MDTGDHVEVDQIARRVRDIQARIQQAAQRAGRKPEAIRLVAVTKTVPVECIRDAVNAGVSMLGENRLQEAVPKIQQLTAVPGVQWHFIGRLQRRKVKTVVALFELIHSVESVELAEEIDQRAREAGTQQRVLLEVNIGREASKGGFAPDMLLDVAQAIDALPNLAVEGLMTIPPVSSEAEASRMHFRALRELAQSLASLKLQRMRMHELSMGMSGDFETAIEEGATMVRVGAAIFGARRG
ncbi:MAG: YggS family pyridoxal phosphate-dependent enzyme [Nitrospira sp.]|nr:YggS family pyridoxal phosphate-dependent enzyme [Nitrospira sp.]